MRVLDFLNANQGAIMALLTAVYVMATLVTTWMIWRSNSLVRKSNELARQSLEQDLQLERERNRPYVIFDFTVDDDCLNAVLSNIGKTAALNVMVEIDKPINRVGKGPIAFVGRPIAFMAPGRTITDGINVAYRVFEGKEEKDLAFVVKVRYSDTRGEGFSEQFNVELNHARNLTQFRQDDHIREAVKELGEIRQQLDNINNAIKQIAWEHNSLLELTATEELPEDKDFDARAFLCANFDDKLRRFGRIRMGLSRYEATIEDEKNRTDILRCECLGLLRREADYFVLTQAGHALVKSGGQGLHPAAKGKGGASSEKAVVQAPRDDQPNK
jgi:hypothetical protein